MTCIQISKHHISAEGNLILNIAIHGKGKYNVQSN